MRKTIIQVPFDEPLLKALDTISRREQESRSELIRRACRRYIESREEEKLDLAYQEGYRRLPESTAIAEAQASLAGEVLPAENW